MPSPALYRFKGAEGGTAPSVSPGHASLRKIYADLTDDQRAMYDQLVQTNVRPLTDADRALSQRVRGASKVPVLIDPSAAIGGGGGYIFGDKKVVLHPDVEHDPLLLSHELGHGVVGSSPWGKAVQNKAVRYGYSLQLPAAIIAATLLSKPSHKALAAAAIIGLGSAPTLIDEHLAWRHGRKLMRDAGASPEQLEDLSKSRSRNLGSYYQMPLVSAAVAAAYGLGSHGMRMLSKMAAPLTNVESDPAVYRFNRAAERNALLDKLQGSLDIADRRTSGTGAESAQGSFFQEGVTG